MRKQKFPNTSLLLVFVLTLCGSLPAQEKAPAISDTARNYLENVLDLMQKNALNRNSIGWAAVRRETLARAQNAQTATDTYPAIAYAFSQLKEHHSFLQLPDSMPYKQKEALEVEMAKISGREQNANENSPFLPSKHMTGHIDHKENKVFAHLVVPMCIGQYAEWDKNAPYFEQFVAQLHDLVMSLQEQKPDGWIIDLRGNSGGDMWPMLAGIGAVIGQGNLGAFHGPQGDPTIWFYKNGKVGAHESGKDEIYSSVKEPPFSFSELPWVAILLDRSTASSGEAVAISLIGRSRERSFGEHTAGFSTSNNMHGLPDGAALFLCEGVEADRTGKEYPDGIEPDVKLPAPQTRPTENADAVLNAAEDWLVQVNTAAVRK